MIDESRRRKRKGGFLDFAGLQRGSRVRAGLVEPWGPQPSHHRTIIHLLKFIAGR